MTTPASSDKVYEDALIEFDSYTRPQPMIDGNLPRLDHTLSRLPNNALSRMHFKTTQQKELTEAIGIQLNKLSDKTSLNDIHLKILQTKLSLKAEREIEERKLEEIKSHDRPLYYQLPSSGVKDFYSEIKNFLPPNVNLGGSNATIKNNMPHFYRNKLKTSDNQAQNRHDTEDEDEMEDDNSSSPTGDWENPIVKQALSRQVDLEYYTKLLLRNILYLIVLLLFKSLARKFTILYEINLKAQPLYKQMMYNSHFNFDTFVGSIYFNIAEQLITIWPLVSILISVARLLKGQDQCWDLPLSNNQRRLIGLQVDDVGEDKENEADLIIRQRKYDTAQSLANSSVPKYKQMTEFTLLNGDSTNNLQDKFATNRWVYK